METKFIPAPSRAQQQAARSAIDLTSTTPSPGPHIVRKIALAHIASGKFYWAVNIASLESYAGPDLHSPLAPWLAEMPKYLNKHINAASIGNLMKLEPSLIVVWCRKVGPLVLWNDRSEFNSLLGTTQGHEELIRLANIYRVSHTFWPSLPYLVEQVLGPPTAAARARHPQPNVSMDALVASARQPRTADWVAEPADAEQAGWGEAQPLPEKANAAAAITLRTQTPTRVLTRPSRTKA